MKPAVVTPVLLVVAAIVQALGMHAYHQDALTLTGQLFFALFLAGVTVVYAPRGRPEAFSVARLVLLVLGALALVLTLTGWGLALYWFYPSPWMFYAAFAALLVCAVLAVASTPAGGARARRDDAPEDRPEDA